MKFYSIKESYLDFLRAVEPKIMFGSSHYSSETKFTLGVVLVINGIKYYAPLSSKKDYQLLSPSVLKKQYRQTCIPIIVEHNKVNEIAGTIRLDLMFPVPDSEIEELIFSKEKKLNKRIFLQKQYIYVVSIKNDILTKTSDLYNKAINPNHYLHSKCCNFKLLEVKYQEWIKNNTI